MWNQTNTTEETRRVMICHICRATLGKPEREGKVWFSFSVPFLFFRFLVLGKAHKFEFYRNSNL